MPPDTIPHISLTTIIQIVSSHLIVRILTDEFANVTVIILVHTLKLFCHENL